MTSSRSRGLDALKAVFARLLDRVSGRRPGQPSTRLSPQEAVAIASAYAKARGLAVPHGLVPQEVREMDGKLVWTLRTPTVGSWVTVGVDDATGEVTGHQAHGVR
jgi:hypothetical protein